MTINRLRRTRAGASPRSGRAPQRLTVVTPASTANLGPGFDTLALALSTYCALTFELLDDEDRKAPRIIINGNPEDGLPTDEGNLIYQTLKKLWGDSSLLRRVRITIDSQIPLGKGLGSSAAAIMGTVWASYALKNENPDDAIVLTQAAGYEGHPDNVSASLLGGLVVCGQTAGHRVITQRLEWPESWCPIVVVPSYALSTKKARKILPAIINRKDAVANVQNVALLLSAVQNKDPEAMKAALHDRLHEPYREQLVPELSAVRKAVSDLPVLGTVLSGAGSSVLTLVQRRHRKQVMECIEHWANKQSKPPAVLGLEVDRDGLYGQYE